MEGEVVCGTSGWSFSFWNKNSDLYRDALDRQIKPSQQLEEYAKLLNMVELNSTFYRVPSEKMVRGWFKRADAISQDFIYCVKMNRYGTHKKLLKDPEEWWPPFWKVISLLGRHLGPILFQFPPKFEKSESNVERLHKLIPIIPEHLNIVFEFRHKSWDTESLQSICEITGWTVAVTHVDNKPGNWSRRKTPWTQLEDGWKDLGLGSKIAYYRLHGSYSQYSGKYQGTLTGRELHSKVRRSRKEGKKVYVAFNNTDSMEQMQWNRIWPSAYADAVVLEASFSKNKRSSSIRCSLSAGEGNLSGLNKL